MYGASVQVSEVLRVLSLLSSLLFSYQIMVQHNIHTCEIRIELEITIVFDSY